jgi:tetratricopeptide (TPR) repeat protein
MNNDEVDKGIEIINKAIAIEPNESFYFYLLGFGYFQKEMYLPARDNLSKAIRLNPYNPEYFGILSFICLNEKNYEVALQNANEGLELDPENITCLNARARALNKLKRTDEAVDTIGDSLSKDPDNEFTHATMGWNYFERGDQKKAAKHFREALRTNPNYESARLGLKESLKSNFTPYKLVIQFGMWMSEKGKKFQWIFFISLYIVFRILRNVASANSGLRPFLLPLFVLYFGFIFFTWIANAIANFFLLFHKDGKYSLTRSERVIGISTVALLVAGLSLGCYVFYSFKESPIELLFPQ